MYDGISPFIPNAIKVNGNNMKFPLVGRGDENPLKKVRKQQGQMLQLLLHPIPAAAGGA